MSVNQDFKDLFKILNEEAVRYIVVGAYAVTFHSEPRYTKDLDILVEPVTDNANKIWKALQRFGAPLLDIEIDDFTNKDLVYQIGIEPNRIDILMNIAGLDFQQAWQNRATSQYADEVINILGLDDLIISKQATGRPQDLIDAENLTKIKSG